MEGSSFPSRTVALAGNPNVGKSTVFNALTGLHQHTGNWPGKTVESARGASQHHGVSYTWVDLPGCYSLLAHSPEEEIARDYIASGEADVTLVVCDATCLARSLALALQTLCLTPRVAVCVNLLDEAAKKGVHIDLAALSAQLGVPVVGTAARSGTGVPALHAAVEQALALTGPGKEIPPAAETHARAKELAQSVCTHSPSAKDTRDRRLDRLLTSRWAGFPIMFVGLVCVFWLTISGANAPSAWLGALFAQLTEWLRTLLTRISAPAALISVLVDGVLRVLTTVVSVMLPPMAVFFPLFTLLEDAGYLPRVAFNLDRCFQGCRACGKQALTMCMGFGCNAAGVVGCRIIDSPRERLIAILTNSLVPCNGRFPTLIALIAMFFVGAGAFAGALSALLLALAVVLAVAATLAMSKLLSVTVLAGLPASFALELPPFRRPQLGKVLARSLLDRTLFVLGRAVTVAAPAGLVLWLLANVHAGGATLLAHAANFLQPAGAFLGMDGVILLAFILGLPANEIVLPIVVMAYSATGTLMPLGSLAALRALLLAHGWTPATALCVALFSLFHWPCATTLQCVRKETQSLKWTLLAVAVPTAAGVLLCAAVSAVAHVL